jgi:hypothetical protein
MRALAQQQFVAPGCGHTTASIAQKLCATSYQIIMLARSESKEIAA